MELVATFAYSLAILYIGQFSLALWNASEKKEDKKSVFGTLFGGRRNVTRTWTTIGIIFIIPVSISWSGGISDRLLSISVAESLYAGTLSMLFVLVTLELSTLNTLNDQNRGDWRGLLLFALSIDIFSIILLVGFVKPVILASNNIGWENTLYVVSLIGVTALLSSFCVILFANEAGRK